MIFHSFYLGSMFEISVSYRISFDNSLFLKIKIINETFSKYSIVLFNFY